MCVPDRKKHLYPECAYIQLEQVEAQWIHGGNTSLETAKEHKLYAGGVPENGPHKV